MRGAKVDSTGTWHHGLVADWWAEFNTDGPEVDYFGRFVEAAQPALDAGCGSGRLLLPWLREHVPLLAPGAPSKTPAVRLGSS